MKKRADALRDVLEEEIVTGSLKPGERLDEVAMATRFGVSRTPIREALFQLSAAGLIEIEPRRGAFVSTIGPQRLVEMFGVAAELEAMCAGFAARRATDEELRSIREAHESCREALDLTDIDPYYYENEVFHQRIRSASHNQFLIEQVNLLQRRLKPYRRLQLRTRGRVKASFNEHDAIMRALEEGDEKRARNTMRDHVTVQGERFSDLLSVLDSASGSDPV